MTKQEVVDFAIRDQQSIIDTQEKTIEELKSNAAREESATFDPDDMSRQAEARDLQMRMELQLTKSKQDLEFLKDSRTKEMEQVGPGAVVETDHYWIFTGISFQPIDFDGKSLIGISTEAPIYKLMMGLEKGKKFKMGDKSQTIKNVL